MPMGISHDEARKVFNQVRKENPTFTPATLRREAARRMGTDYDTYLKAWKKPSKDPIQPPPQLPKPVPDIEPAPAPPTPAPTIDLPPALTPDTARKQATLVKKENPSFTDAQARHEAARRMGVDYDTFLRAWKQGKGTRTRRQPTVPRPPDLSDVLREPKKLWKVKERKALSGPSKVTIRQATSRMIQYDVDGKDFGQILKSMDGLYRVYINGQVKFKSRHLGDADEFIRDMAHNGLPDHLAVNPGWGAKGTTMNCTSATSSWELRRRGFDVMARKMDQGQALYQVYQSWRVASPEVGKLAQFFGDINKMPDGARGFMTVIWRKDGSHIFNWEKRDGDVWFIDAQSGQEWKRWDCPHFAHAQERVHYARVDNLPTPTRDSLNWLTTDEGKQTPTPGYGR